MKTISDSLNVGDRFRVEDKEYKVLEIINTPTNKLFCCEEDVSSSFFVLFASGSTDRTYVQKNIWFKNN